MLENKFYSRLLVLGQFRLREGLKKSTVLGNMSVPLQTLPQAVWCLIWSRDRDTLPQSDRPPQRFLGWLIRNFETAKRRKTMDRSPWGEKSWIGWGEVPCNLPIVGYFAKHKKRKKQGWVTSMWLVDISFWLTLHCNVLYCSEVSLL